MRLYRNEILDQISREVICQYDPELLDKPMPIPIESIIETVYGLTLEYQYIRKNGQVLGETIFEDAFFPIYSGAEKGYQMLPFKAGTIIIDAGLTKQRQYGRFRYTCAHELAHWLLDREYYQGASPAGEAGERKGSSRYPDVMVSGGSIAAERQADRLASRLLMPAGTVKMAFYQKRGPFDIVTLLANKFRVSYQAMRIRLRDLGLYQEV